MVILMTVMSDNDIDDVDEDCDDNEDSHGDMITNGSDKINNM